MTPIENADTAPPGVATFMAATALWTRDGRDGGR
jgi:hypothetical protein